MASTLNPTSTNTSISVASTSIALSVTNITTSPSNSTTTAPGFWPSLLDKIPLPRWAIYAIIALVLLVILICVLCCCAKCCCKGKKKKKKKPDQKINLKGLSGSTTTALVQPETDDAEYGSVDERRGKLLYSLEYNAARSEVYLKDEFDEKNK